MKSDVVFTCGQSNGNYQFAWSEIRSLVIFYCSDYDPMVWIKEGWDSLSWHVKGYRRTHQSTATDGLWVLLMGSTSMLCRSVCTCPWLKLCRDGWWGDEKGRLRFFEKSHFRQRWLATGGLWRGCRRLFHLKRWVLHGLFYLVPITTRFLLWKVAFLVDKKMGLEDFYHKIYFWKFSVQFSYYNFFFNQLGLGGGKSGPHAFRSWDWVVSGLMSWVYQLGMILAARCLEFMFDRTWSGYD